METDRLVFLSQSNSSRKKYLSEHSLVRITFCWASIYGLDYALLSGLAIKAWFALRKGTEELPNKIRAYLNVWRILPRETGLFAYAEIWVDEERSLLELAEESVLCNFIASGQITLKQDRIEIDPDIFTIPRDIRKGITKRLVYYDSYNILKASHKGFGVKFHILTKTASWNLENGHVMTPAAINVPARERDSLGVRIVVLNY
jgi:hypothetical protein